MSEHVVTLRDAKAHLSALSDDAASGEDVVISKHGRPVARLTAAKAPRQPVNLVQLQALTQKMPPQQESAGHFMRDVRDDSRY